MQELKIVMLNPMQNQHYTKNGVQHRQQSIFVKGYELPGHTVCPSDLFRLADMGRFKTQIGFE